MDAHSVPGRQRSCMAEPAATHDDDPGRTLRAGVRSSPVARLLLREWRRLAGGRAARDAQRRTLVACSGGADSTALLLCLGSGAREHVVAGHIRHDLRPEAQTAGDERAVEALAARLGVHFVRASVRVRDEGGNAESNARRARYRELERLAREAGCPYVATGHQGDDQLETMLMRLLRGAGVGGLAGIRPSRPLGRAGVVLVRPMLGLGREEAADLCRGCGLDWREDSSNADVSRWRARLRAEVVPVLRDLRPSVHRRAGEAAGALADAAELIRESAEVLLARAARGADGSVVWRRADVEGVAWIVVGEAIRLARRALRGEAREDRLRGRELRAIGAALRDPDRRVREWRVAGVLVVLDSSSLAVRIGAERSDAGLDRP